MDPIVVHDLPASAQAALRELAARHHRTVDAEVQAILLASLSPGPVTIGDRLSGVGGTAFDLGSSGFGLTTGAPDL